MNVTEPTDIAVAIPEELIDAMPALLVAHVPPEAVDVYVPGVPEQIVAGPLIVPALGEELTVTVSVAAAVPQLFATV